MTLRVAVIGAGYFSRFHYDGWARIDGAELVAACATDLDQARRMAGAHGIPQTFDDAAAMLDATSPDLVDIVTPPATHLGLVGLAAARGIPAVCQKPMAPTLAEAERMTRIAGDAGIPLIVHENFRFMPWYRKAHELVRAGRLGDLHTVAFRLRPGDGQGPDAYLGRQPYFQEMERFLVHETAIHFIDTFRFLMGEVTRVFAWLRRLNPAIAGEDAGYILFDFAGGRSGIFDGNRLNAHPTDRPLRTLGEMWLEGSGGVLRLDGTGRLFLMPHGEPEAEIAYDWRDINFGGDCVYETQRHIVAHLTDGAPLETAAGDYLRNVEIEDAIYRSSVEGRWVAV